MIKQIILIGSYCYLIYLIYVDLKRKKCMEQIIQKI